LLQVPLSSSITDFLHSGFVEYGFFTGTTRYRDLFRTSSQWWAYNDCVQRWVLELQLSGVVTDG
jgi:hypothetical protein